jgi:hypothetical protein
MRRTALSTDCDIDVETQYFAATVDIMTTGITN